MILLTLNVECLKIGLTQRVGDFDCFGNDYNVLLILMENRIEEKEKQGDELTKLFTSNKGRRQCRVVLRSQSQGA